MAVEREERQIIAIITPCLDTYTHSQIESYRLNSWEHALAGLFKVLITEIDQVKTRSKWSLYVPFTEMRRQIESAIINPDCLRYYD